MNFPSREYIEHLREKYSVGSRIQINELNDPYSKLKSGEAGNLLFIDDIGTYHVKWDNGSTLGLIPGEDRFSILPPHTSTLKLYMPMNVELYERSEWGDYDESVEIPAQYATEYADLIRDAILKERQFCECERGMMEYYDRSDNINFKVKSYNFDVEVRDGALWGVAKCEIYGELTDSELELLKDNITGQAADGFGEGFEQRDIYTPDGDMIYAHLWSSRDWNIQTEQELFGQDEVMDMQM